MQIHLRLPNQYPGRFTGNDRRHGGVVSSGAGYRQYTHSGGASLTHYQHSRRIRNGNGPMSQGIGALTAP